MSNDQLLSLSRDDYQYLISLLHASKIETASPSQQHKPIHPNPNTHIVSSVTKLGNSWNPKLTWILDLGASDHICPFLNSFTSYSLISTVKLQNGETTVAHFSGTIHLIPTLILYDVVHIPGFQFNLVSIHKLTTSLSCQLIFSPNLCAIQDLSTLKMIGHASVSNDLYILQQSLYQSPFFVNNTHSNSVFFICATIG